MRKKLGKIKNEKQRREYRKKLSIRKTVIGTTERPRLCVVKTNKHIQVQVINDEENKTLFSVQTFGKNSVGDSANIENAKKVGEAVAKKLTENKIDTVVFDRNGKVYTGVIAAVADSVREHKIKL
jgi:large subunit ribosomal protein L18